MANTFTAQASLPKPVDESQIMQDFENLQTACNNAMDILETMVAGSQTAADAGANASVINTGGKRIVFMQNLCAGSISTIIGAVQNVPFTMIWQSAVSGLNGIPDLGIFKINTAFLPTLNSCITLMWDGTNFIEISRTSGTL